MISGYNQLVNCYIVLDSSGNQVISMPICVPIIDGVLRAVIVQAIGSYFFYVIVLLQIVGKVVHVY